jgi:SpoVK/Ycf46/Vps4 family AAA+-type ATPase
MAKALATEAGLNFLAVKGPESARSLILPCDAARHSLT